MCDQYCYTFFFEYFCSWLGNSWHDSCVFIILFRLLHPNVEIHWAVSPLGCGAFENNVKIIEKMCPGREHKDRGAKKGCMNWWIKEIVHCCPLPAQQNHLLPEKDRRSGTFSIFTLSYIRHEKKKYSARDVYTSCTKNKNKKCYLEGMNYFFVLLFYLHTYFFTMIIIFSAPIFWPFPFPPKKRREWCFLLKKCTF